MKLLVTKVFKNKLFQWWTIAVIMFVSLDWFYISVGDDLGYMFTDKTLHSCVGERIDNITDCIKTQAEHYKSTNGRFIVHLLVSYFVSIGGRTLFIFCNGIMFGFLWLLVYRLLYPKKSSDNVNQKAILVLFLLWIFLPVPGITMLSLVAFSINYMWSGVLYLLAFKYISESIRKSSFKTYEIIFKSLLLIIIGSLQESYSIPLVGATGLYLIYNKKNINCQTWVLFFSFTIGALFEILAPGNFNHLNQGGGLTIDNILRKSTLLIDEIVLSPIMILLLITLLLKLLNGFKLRNINQKDSIILIIAIVISLMFASLTYTSIRQIFAPYLFAIIMIGRILSTVNWSNNLRKIGTSLMSVCLLFILFGSFILRQNTYSIFEESLKLIKESVDSNKTITKLNLSECNYNKTGLHYYLLNRYDCDPFEDTYLHFIFDGYTKRGYSRLLSKGNSENKIKTLLPYPIDSIVNKLRVKEFKEECVGNNLRLNVLRLDNKYSVARLSRKYKFSLPFISLSDKRNVKFEMFSTTDYYYFVLPNISDEVWIKSYENLNLSN